MNNISWVTLKVYLSAVRQLHINQGLTLPSALEIKKLTQVLRGIRIFQAAKETAAPRKHLPITPDLRQIKRPSGKQRESLMTK